MPEISVIVPVYNCEKYLEKCINSILSQTFDDLELILINDGSSDNTDELVKPWLSIAVKFAIILKKKIAESK